MGIQTTANPADVANRMQTYLHRRLIEPLGYSLQLARLPGAMSPGIDIPGSNGATSMRCFKPAKADASQVQTLTEGVVNTTYSELTTGYKDISLTQHGISSRISDVLQAIDILNWIDANTDWLARSMAKKVDDVIGDALIAGMQDINNDHELFCGVPRTGDGDDDFASLSTLATANAKATRVMFLKAATILRNAGVPEVPGGGYLALVSPSAMFDLRQDDTWLKAVQESAPDKLWNWSNYRTDSIRFVETNNPRRETVYGTTTSAGNIYSNFVFGSGAYGCPTLTGTQRAGQKFVSPSVKILNNADKADPYNVFAQLVMKIYWGAALLLTNLSGDVPHCVNVRCKSTVDA